MHKHKGRERERERERKRDTAREREIELQSEVHRELESELQRELYRESYRESHIATQRARTIADFSAWQDYSKLSRQCSHKNFMFIVLCFEELCLKECPVGNPFVRPNMVSLFMYRNR